MLNLSQFLRKAIFYKILKNNNALEDFQRLTKQSKKMAPSMFIDKVLSRTNKLSGILLAAFAWDMETKFNQWVGIHTQLSQHHYNSQHG